MTFKLFAYIRPCANNSFTIPIYTDGEKCYQHCLYKNSFKIKDFYEDRNFRYYVDNDQIFEIKYSETFEVGDYGSFVFCSNDIVIFGHADRKINELLDYVNGIESDCPNLRDEVILLSNQLTDPKYKEYNVTLWSLVDPVRDSELDKPETKMYEYNIIAESPESAKDRAKEIHKLSVWESDVDEL